MLLGEDNIQLTNGLTGLCEIKLGTFSFAKSKRSSEMAMIIIWRMLFENDFKYRKKVRDAFVGFDPPDLFRMDLGAHFNNANLNQLLIKIPGSINYAFEFIRFLKGRRRSLVLKDIIKKPKHKDLIEKMLVEKKE